MCIIIVSNSKWLTSPSRKGLSSSRSESNAKFRNRYQLPGQGTTTTTMTSSSSSEDRSNSSSVEDDDDEDSYETGSGWSTGDDDATTPFFPKSWASNFMLRRRAAAVSSSPSDADDHSNRGHNDDHKNMNRRRRKRLCRRGGGGGGGGGGSDCGEVASTWCVIGSCTMFLYVMFWAPFSTTYYSDPHKTVRQRTKERLQRSGSYGSQFFANFKIFREEHEKVVVNENRDTEALPEGCVPMAWQANNYPNCNLLHEISLPAIQRGTSAGHYVASGLWRDVWQVSLSSSSRKNHDEGAARSETTRRRNDEQQNTAVLKILRMEHEVNARNFDRHRRDALVMEQLTANPYLVDVFGYCGNSILTESLSVTLYDAIVRGGILVDDDSDDVQAVRDGNDNNNTVKQKQQNRSIGPARTNVTRTDRLHWAIDVAKGVQALHEHGIVHADLHDPERRERQRRRIKINDFNRCRFLAVRQNDTTTRCPFRIPSAPGKQRSPEEYDFQQLTDKMDIYATANLLYAIFTRKRPWGDFASAEAKRRITSGYLPPMDHHYYNGGVDDDDEDKLANKKNNDNDSVVDPAFVAITHRAYALDPMDRPNATELVAALEQLL
jgi:serine/threonine protein kinase